MSLTRLKNIITSRTGRIIYVNPDDFDASDAIDNRGNSALRPFKSIQRAFLEVARFSYRVGLSNDEFDAFSIMLYPAEYVLITDLVRFFILTLLLLMLTLTWI